VIIVNGSLLRLLERNRTTRLITGKIIPRYYFESMMRLNYNPSRHWNGKNALLSLSFDVDYSDDALVLPEIIDILSSYPFKANFACVGKGILQYPRQHALLVDEGHEIVNHTYSHPNSEEWNPDEKFNLLNIHQQRFEIEKCDEVCRKTLGYQPVGFRIPHFGNLYTDAIYPLLSELGYKYSSSISAARSPSFGLPYACGNITEFPLSPCPDHPFGVFDTWHSLKRGNGLHCKKGEFFALFKDLVQIGLKYHLFLNTYFDPMDVMDLRDFVMILDYLDEIKNEIAIKRYGDVYISK